jgi:hypothetical protein
MHIRLVSLALAVFVVVAVIAGFVIVHTVQNDQRAAACEARGGTAYGRDNWLCAR